MEETSTDTVRIQFCSGDLDVTNDAPEFSDVTEIRWWESEDGPHLVVERAPGDCWTVTSALPYIPEGMLGRTYAWPSWAWDAYREHFPA